MYRDLNVNMSESISKQNLPTLTRTLTTKRPNTAPDAPNDTACLLVNKSVAILPPILTNRGL